MQEFRLSYVEVRVVKKKKKVKTELLNDLV